MTALETWLMVHIAQEAGLPPGDVDAATPIYRYGLDSRALMRVVEGAEREFALLVDLDGVSPAETIGALAQAFAPA